MKDLVVDRLHALAGTLAGLRTRVREAVAGERYSPAGLAAVGH